MKNLQRAIVAVVTLLLLGGCTGRDMVHVNRSMKAETIFQSWPLPEEYDYYYYGRDISPEAFLALDKQFTMQSDFWKKIFPTIRMREFWKDEFKTRWMGIDNDFRGMELISSDNRKIGLIYTKNYWVTAWFPEPGSNLVTIPPPEPAPSQSRPGKDASGGGNR